MNILNAPWRQLSGQEGFLVQTQRKDAGYNVRVTDLRTVWGEDLDNEEFRRRAEEVKCPIDVDVDLHVIMDHLDTALTQPSDSIDLLVKVSDEVSLNSTERIGKVTLEWYFNCAPLPNAISQLGFSVFQMVTYYQDTVDALTDVIAAKDTVIRQIEEHCTSSNIPYTPVRRTKAQSKFEYVPWRSNRYQTLGKGDIARIGRKREHDEDWRYVLRDLPDWPTRKTIRTVIGGRKIPARKAEVIDHETTDDEAPETPKKKHSTPRDGESPDSTTPSQTPRRKIQSLISPKKERKVEVDEEVSKQQRILENRRKAEEIAKLGNTKKRKF